MGGLIDPFISSPAWPEENASNGTSWASSTAFPALADSLEAYKGAENNTARFTTSTSDIIGTEAEDIKFHQQDGTSSMLTEPLLQQELHDNKTQGLNFALEGAIECALMAGSFGSVLSTSCPMSVIRSAPAIGSSNESNGGKQSGLPQCLVDEKSIASAMWPSSYVNASSLVSEQISQTFGFEGIPCDDTLQQTCTAPVHDSIEFPTHQLLSFSAGQQMTLNATDLKAHQKELNGLDHLNLPSFASGPHTSFNGAGTLPNSQQCAEVNSGKHEVGCALGTPSEAPHANGNGSNGVSKPRVRARRGQATDPHSIAERLRREKISERMKNLQELVPNSNKTDKASMLDEIIEYVKFLQLQVKVLSMSRLGATEAVVPLITESKNESSSLLVPPSSGGQGGFEQPEREDNSSFEQEVVKLMESNVTTAMQYLQNKGLCLMPIALATAISNQKGSSSASIPGGAISRCMQNHPEADVADDGISSSFTKADAKKVDVLKPLSSPGEMKSRA